MVKTAEETRLRNAENARRRRANISSTAPFPVSNITAVVAEVQAKVEAMNVELQMKNHRVRELQAELTRLNMAKDRRAEKCRKNCESRQRAL